MAKLDFLEVVGAFTGNAAARLKLAGAAHKVQAALEQKAEIIGVGVGKKLGGNVLHALARGGKAGETQAVDTLAKEQVGVSLSSVKENAVYVAAVAGALGVLILARIFRR